MTEPSYHPAAPARGSRVALVAPGGPVAAEGIDRALARVRSLGWEPVLGAHARGNVGYLSAPDAQRVADLNAALRDEENAAIWCLRGGYGAMRVLDRIDWRALERRPRPLIGFSDNTALHLVAQRRGLVTFHGPHPAARELAEFSLESLRTVLHPSTPEHPLPLPPGHPQAQVVRGGVAEGRLVGGNLALLAATIGTPEQLDSRGAILFLEDVGEPMYRLDRMLTQLRRAGTLDGVAAFAVGAVSERPDEDEPGIPTVAELVEDRLGDLDVPIVVGLPFGHVPASWTLPVGVLARLDAGSGSGSLRLLEPATV